MARPRRQYRICKHCRIDKKTGEKKESYKWNIYFIDHLQIERRLSGTPDKSTTEYIAKNIIAIVNQKICSQQLTQELRTFIESQPKKLREQLSDWGILDANTNSSFEPLIICTKIKANHSKSMKYDVTGGHVYDWRLSIEANERSPQHVNESIQKVAMVISDCGFITPSDINGEKIENWRTNFKNKGKSSNFVNSYLMSFKAFILWMSRNSRISSNPIKHLRPLQEHDDKKRTRRSLTEKEINKLITATINAKKFNGLTGYERSLVYRIALGTGLRYNEIYTLKRNDITFGDEPCVTVRAVNAKNKKSESIPLNTELATELKQYYSDNLAMPQIKVFSGMWTDVGAKMLRQDLAIAGIEPETEDGIVDFHSLRHTFGTLLALSGVLPQEAQKLMRHSDINLTMNIYTHLRYADKAKAISKLPTIQIERQREPKTGTADTPENFSTNLSENPIKIHQNISKSSNDDISEATNTKAITSCNTNSLQKVTAIRPAGFGPAAYGLEIRCSIQLSYGRK